MYEEKLRRRIIEVLAKTFIDKPIYNNEIIITPKSLNWANENVIGVDVTVKGLMVLYDNNLWTWMSLSEYKKLYPRSSFIETRTHNTLKSKLCVFTENYFSLRIRISIMKLTLIDERLK